MASSSSLRVGDNSYEIYRLDALQASHDVARLPYTLRILLENVLRTGDDGYASQVLKEDARRKKGQLTRREGARRPRRQRMNILLGDDMPVEAAEEVLEEHADGEGQTADIGEAKFGKAVEAVVRDGAGGCFERS